MPDFLQRIFLFAALTSLLVACQNRKESGEDSGERYHDVRVSAEEGGDSITVVLQYRQDGEEGKSMALADGTTVELDGVAFTPDSARQGGIFYERAVAAAGFAGKHKISFTDADGKKEEEEFRFKPFALAEEFPAEVTRQPFTIRLKDFPLSPTRILLTITDTSFASKDVNDELTVDSATIRVNESHLSRLVKGPVVLEVFYDEEKPLKNAKNPGRLLITYSLRREFELVE